MLKLLARRTRVNCPNAETLLAHAVGGGDAAVERHLKQCSTCRTEIAELREAAARLRSPASLQSLAESPHCLDEFAVAGLVDGRLGPGSREPVVAHLLECARCRSLVTETAGAMADPVLAGTIAAAGRGPAGRRRLRNLSGLAAAAVVVLLLWPKGTAVEPELREPALTMTVAPAPIAPRALVPGVNEFSWGSVPRALRYRLRLYDREGTVLWRAETRDTSIVLPDTVALVARVPYFWRVEAQIDWRRWTAADMVEFRLARGEP
jgi:hypothetical protein